MPSVTVLGANGTIHQVTFTSGENLTLAQQLAKAINQGVRVGGLTPTQYDGGQTPTGSANYLVDPMNGSSVTVPAGYSTVVVADTPNRFAGPAVTLGNGPDTLVLHVSQDAFQGDAQFNIAVDGQRVGSGLTASVAHATGDSQAFVLQGEFGPGPHTVYIDFLNPVVGDTPTTSRTLYIDSIDYQGQTTTSANPAITTTAYQTFTTDPNAPPTPPATAGSTSATVTGNGTAGQMVVAGSGDLVFDFGQGTPDSLSSGVVVTGDGNNRITTASVNGGLDNIQTGAGDDTISVLSGGTPLPGSSLFSQASTVSAGTGNNTITLYNSESIVTVTGKDTITAGSGNDLIGVSGNGQAYVQSTNANVFFINGAAASTVQGSSGSATIFAGDGGGFYQVGTGGNSTIVGGTGTMTALGGADGDTIFVSPGTSANNLIIAGVGNETLEGANSSGNNVFAVGQANTITGGVATRTSIDGGNGNDSIYGNTGDAVMSGGPGHDLFYFVNGQAGSTNTIFGFNPNERVEVQGYGYDAASFQSEVLDHALTSRSGGVTIQLRDSTIITFYGVNNLTAKSFDVS